MIFVGNDLYIFYICIAYILLVLGGVVMQVEWQAYAGIIGREAISFCW